MRVPLLAFGLGSLICAHGQAAVSLSAEDYARAESFMPYRTTGLVRNAVTSPTWLSDGRAWYRRSVAQGSEIVLLRTLDGASRRAFDPERMAHALSAASGTSYEAARRELDESGLSADGGSVSGGGGAIHWTCDIELYRCEKSAVGASDEVPSPDGHRAVFIRDHNLWVRDLQGGAIRQLTTDGVADFGYATDNAGWKHTARAIVSWSPDGKRIATYQQDERGVGSMYLVSTRVGRPQLEAWKYALPGDTTVPTIQRVVIELESGRVVRLQMAPDERRAAHCYDLDCGPGGSLTDVQWRADGKALAFISVSRDHKRATLRVADADTGAVRDVLEETQATYYESASGWMQQAVNWRYLWASHEVVWFSQRDDWGQLYLYDGRTGKLKHRITSGAWNVVDLLGIDERRRVAYLIGVGREADRDPYFRHLYRVGLDRERLTLLTPENADHEVSLEPSGKHFIDCYSTPETPPTAILRGADGREIRVLERADITRLTSLGWKPPAPITVKARDGHTDLHGLMFRPIGFHEDASYPLIDVVYPGPMIGSVGSRAFAAARGDAQSLAELGFIVVEIDGMGTSLRSKSFQDVSYGNLEDNTLPDQVAAIHELARRSAWIDLERVGIAGHSGGGYAAAIAMFRYPELFKVGVSESGNHDQRGYEGDWGEQYLGLLDGSPDQISRYDRQADLADSRALKGHLLLMHGTGDDNVPPNMTLLLVDALIHANKDFDLILLPNDRHLYAGEHDLYATRRRWDYFVRHLSGAEPPAGYQLHDNSR